MGQQNGIGDPMMGPEFCGELMRQRMGCAESLLEGKGAHRRGHGHLGSGLTIGAFIDCGHEVFGNQANPFKGHCFGCRMVLRRKVGLDVMAECIHSG